MHHAPFHKAKLVATVTGPSVDRLLAHAAAGCDGAALVEFRVDGITEAAPDLKRLVDSKTLPAVLTCRSQREGGLDAGTSGERLERLHRAADLGFEHVDFELFDLRDAGALPRRDERASVATRIVSHHDLEQIPNDAEQLVDDAVALGADIVKLAAHVDGLADILRLAALGERVRAQGKKFVPVALGPHGVSGRILASHLGAELMYAAARGVAAAGAGQLGVDQMLGRFRFDEIGPETAIYGILGTHALQSRSPAMHNAFFDRIGYDGVYVPFQERDLESFIGAARELGIRGLSVTLPFKESIVPLLDDVDSGAARLGAVNTVVVEGGIWRGTNTDVDGVREPLATFGGFEDQKVAVVGAGGAARAACFAMKAAGADVHVLARRVDAAQAVADAVGGTARGLDALSETDWSLLINATPVGSASCDTKELPIGHFSPETVVFDMVTAPEETLLLRAARDAGAPTVSGIQMLAAQAVRQAALWTGETPLASDMEKSARRGGEAPLDARTSRYSRQILFDEIGEVGQRRIRDARVLVVGVGALGSVSSEMLTRAGVGSITVVDRDYLDASNLQRQTLYDEEDLAAGLPKAVAAARKLRRINREVQVESFVEDLHAGNILAMFERADLVLDGTDNFETRYLLNDASVKTGVPWIYAACVSSYGMSFVVLPGKTPCLRCFMEDEPAPGTSPSCDTAGVIAPIVHTVAAFQVAEALKLLSGRQDALNGSIVSFDVWKAKLDSFRPADRREDCPACGQSRWDYLEGTERSHAVTLCGRDAVQIRPSGREMMDLDAVASRLRALGDVSVNDYLLRFELGDYRLVLFRDGRAIVHGARDPKEARSLYARYIGS